MFDKVFQLKVEKKKKEGRKMEDIVLKIAFSRSEAIRLRDCLSREIDRIERRMGRGKAKESDIIESSKLIDLYNYISLSFDLPTLNCIGAFESRAKDLLNRNV